jgi:glycosyltransferase involved in cell wall biosynthesis
VWRGALGMPCTASGQDSSLRQEGRALADDQGRLVSVVVPFFNTPEPFVREAVDSILAQEYRPIEVFLVDDGSSESSSSMARVIADNSGGRIRYVTHPDGGNRGVSASRNLGVSQSSGKYVAFLDSDDVWRSGKLAEQVDLLESMPDVAMVSGLSEYWYDWKDVSHDKPRGLVPARGVRKTRVLRTPEFVVQFLRGRIIVPGPSSFMVRREAYLACGGFEDEFTGMYEDQVFYAKLGLKFKVCMVPKCWDRYRQHAASLTATARASREEILGRRRFLQWLAEYCRANDIDLPEVWEAIAKALWLCPETSGESMPRLVKVATWAKKWLLNLEEITVPRHVRERWWRHRAMQDSGEPRH